MSGKRRSPSQVSRDRRRIAEMYLRGDLQADIADELEIDQATVSRDIAALHDEWRKSTLIDINAARARELAKTDALEIEYWRAWKRSQENAEVKTTEKIGVVTDANNKIIGNRIKQTDRVEGQSGNPAFLAGVQWCINKRCEILGLDAPKKADLTSNGQTLKGYTILAHPDMWDGDENAKPK